MAVTLAQANRAIAAALARANEMGSRISVSICDDAAHLIAHQRMDGVLAEASRASIGKAMVAAGFGEPSGAAHPQPTPDLPYARKVSSGEVPAWPTRGGLPIRLGHRIEGAIGVAGASADEDDETCAIAGLKAIEGNP